MKSVTQLRSLGDIRTAVSTHTRSTPRHKGSTYLDILSLGMEQLRLETEQAWLARRRRRIERRVREIQENMGGFLAEVQQTLVPQDPQAVRASEPAVAPQGNWNTISVGY